LAITDQELVDKTMTGNSESYGLLYDRYVGQIYRYIYFQVGNRQDAEDLTENVFLKTYESFKNKKTKIENIKSWFYRSAKNLVIDYYRTQKNTFPIDHFRNKSDKEISPESNFVFNEDHKRLKTAFEMLDPSQQMIITLRFLMGLSHGETAEIMNLKVGTLRVLQFRALRKLRKILEEC
jgi:RNA polymerase sigma-70 factor, ECF subfamily